jgi:hypothetical protein
VSEIANLTSDLRIADASLKAANERAERWRLRYNDQLNETNRLVRQRGYWFKAAMKMVWGWSDNVVVEEARLKAGEPK